MSDLAKAQQWFVAAVTAPRVPALRGRLIASAIPAPTGLGIYRHAYHARLRECLADDFPALRSLFGERRFTTLADAVIAAHPPREATLNRYGRRLLGVLRARTTAPSARAALDLARLEWALVQAIHAPLAAPLDIQIFATVPADRWAEVRLQAAPSLGLVRSSWDVNGALRQHQRGEPVTPPVRELGITLILRRSDGIHQLRFTGAGSRMVERLVRGRPLGEALAGVALPAATVHDLLRAVVAGGAIHRFDLP